MHEPLFLKLTLMQSLARSLTLLMLTIAAVSLISSCRNRATQVNLSPSSKLCGPTAKPLEDIFNYQKSGVAVISSNTQQGSAFVVFQSMTSTYLVTNKHVVGNDQGVTVKWVNGLTDSAKVIAVRDGDRPQDDLALLELPAVRGSVLSLSSRSPSIGTDIIVIGAPQGLDFSLTKGVISAFRDSGQITQIDAPVNPGNSGGPVIDKYGCVAGIVTFKLDNSEGLNFAISAPSLLNFNAQHIPGYSSNPQISATLPPAINSTPFPPAPAGSSASGGQHNSGKPNCWFQDPSNSTNLLGQRCSISTRPGSNGSNEVRITAPNVSYAVYIYPNNKAIVFSGGVRSDGTWKIDSDSDTRVSTSSGTIAFSASN